MRVVLQKGKQRELVNYAKNKFTWGELSKKLGYCEGYIRNDLRREISYLSEDAYRKLCILAGVHSDKFIVEKLPENWGKVKGAKRSSGNTKKLIEPPESEELAELFGILLGDGHIDKIVRGKNTRCYCITIAGDSNNDKDYLENYVRKMLFKLFGENGRISYSNFSNSLYLKLHGRRIVDFFVNKGISNGNKKVNHQSIPYWIIDNDEYLKNCIRGLMDTDGSVHYISKNNKNIRLSFTSYIPHLLGDVRTSFIRLGFHPSKIIKGRQIFLSRKADFTFYMDNIGFSNQKHLKRIEMLRNGMLP